MADNRRYPHSKTAKPPTIVETRNPPPEGLDPDLAWYLVYCGARAEAKAKKGLEDAGCMVFWPSVHRVISREGHKPIEHDVGTFPRYLFVTGVPFRETRRDRVQEDRTVITVSGRPIDDLRDIDGVVDVVGTSRGWLKVPGAAIAAIAGYQKKAPPPPEPKRALQAGQQVTIIEGPFMDFQATIVEQIGLDEASILIDIFGRPTKTTMAVDDLRAA